MKYILVDHHGGTIAEIKEIPLFFYTRVAKECTKYIKYKIKYNIKECSIG